MGRPRISVITPVHVWNQYRKDGLTRAAESVGNQSFKDFEWIVVNDGSTVEFSVPSWARVIDKLHEERVCAYSAGLEKAKGEIICFLDSDDEYEPNYLERIDSFFRQYPKFKMFNFGARYINQDASEWIRGVFKPRKRKVGHAVFGGGKIVNGTFAFHRDVYDDLGAYPPVHVRMDCSELNYNPKDDDGNQLKGDRDLYSTTPYDFSAIAQMQFPEIRKYFMVDHHSEPRWKIVKELGNPWGNDYYLFYKYTRKYHSKAIDEPLYVVHSKVGVQ